MIKFLVRVVAVFILAVSLSGCGTYIERVRLKGFSSSGYYKGTFMDLKLLGLYRPGYETMFCYGSIICPGLVLLSLPVDLVVDTLSIPFDYSREPRNEEMTYAQAKSAATHGYLNLDFSASSKVKDGGGVVSYWVHYRGNSKDLYLMVRDASLVDSVVEVYIPYFKDYKPGGVSIYYGSGRGSLEVNFKYGVREGQGLNEYMKRNDQIHQNRNEFIYHDSSKSHEGPDSKVFVTPFFNNDNVWFSASGRLPW